MLSGRMEPKFANWMALLSAPQKNRPISHLYIPGTHNSFTYSLDKQSPVGPDEGKFMAILSKIFGPLAKHIIYKWAVCQKLSVIEQLAQGVRYFDFRLSKLTAVGSSCGKTEQKDCDIRVIHALFGCKVSKVLDEISSFLKFHPQEVVLLDFQHFYGLDHDDLISLRTLITRTFGDKICPTLSKIPTLDHFQANAYQVMVICDNFFAKGCSWSWPRKLCPNPWANTTNSDALERFILSKLRDRNQDRLFVSQAIFTLDVPTLLKHPFSSLETKLAVPCDEMVSKNTLNRITREHLPLNIMLLDFIEKDDLVKKIIQLNFPGEKSPETGRSI